MRQLTPQQDAFITNYLMTSKPKQSAIDAGYSPKCAYNTAYSLLRSPHVKKVIEERQEESRKMLMDHLVSQAEKAVCTLISIMEDPDQKGATRVAAAKDLLDRAGYKAPDHVQVTGKDDGPIELLDPKALLLSKLTTIEKKG